MLVIAKATMNEFEKAVEYARRHGPRAALIHRSLDITVSYVSDAASAFWDRELVGGVFDDKVKWERAIDRFYGQDCKVRLAHDLHGDNIKKRADAGYIVLNGSLRGLWSNVPGKGKWLLDNAISDGAVRLNCYDVQPLVQLYESRGFEIVRREANAFDHNQPDVVWMERHGS